MRSPIPARFRTFDCRRVAMLHGQRGEDTVYAAVANNASLRIRRPGLKWTNKRKVVTQ